MSDPYAFAPRECRCPGACDCKEEHELHVIAAWADFDDSTIPLHHRIRDARSSQEPLPIQRRAQTSRPYPAAGRPHRLARHLRMVAGEPPPFDPPEAA